MRDQLSLCCRYNVITKMKEVNYMKVALIKLFFVLYRSDSVNGLESDTINGFNGMISRQKVRIEV